MSGDHPAPPSAGSAAPPAVGRRPWPARSGRPWLILAAVTGVGMAAVMLKASRQRDGSNAAALIRDLVEAAGTARLAEGRLSAGFAAGPTPRRSTNEPRQPVPRSIKLMSAITRIETLAEREPSAESLHALGLAHLALEDHTEAIAALEQALAVDEKDPRAMSDLAAVLLERQEARDGLEESMRALSFVEEALEVDPAAAEPQFNRALALERLLLRGSAIEAWNQYLQVDPDSPWADEAMGRKDRLALPSPSETWRAAREALEAAARSGDLARLREMIAGQLQAAREWLLYEELARWAGEILRGDVAAASGTWRAAENIARVHSALSTDPMAVEIVAAIDPRPGENLLSPRLRSLATAHEALVEARRKLAEFRMDEARPLLERARVAFQDGGSPAWLWAARGLLVTAYYRREYEPTLRRLASTRAEAEKHAYHAVVGHLRWLEGLIGVVQARLSNAVGHYQRGLAAFERGGESGNAAVIRSLLSECLHALGDHDEEWRQREGALTGLGEEMEARRSEGILMEAAIASLEDGFPRAAFHFQEAGLASALERGDAVQTANGLLWRGLIHTRLRQWAEAVADLERAEGWVGRIADADLHGRLEAELAYTRGMAGAVGDPDAARAALTRAIDHFQGGGAALRLPELYLARGRFAHRQGDDSGASADFLAGIEAFEAQRLAVIPPGQRISFFDTAAELFDEAIGLTVERDGPAAALTLAERGRARQLLEGMPSGGAPLAAAEVEDRIPDDTAVVFYASLPQRLLCWVVNARGVEIASTQVGPQDLARLVAQLRDALSDAARQEEVRAAAIRLHDLLIRPVAGSLAESHTLVFVPDKALHAIPMAMLLDRETGRYLIETHEVLVAPSATLFVRASERARQLDPVAPPTLLAVGDPSFDATAYPYLPRLEAAAWEATQISALYASAAVLRGPDATKSAFLHAMEGRSIVHYAGHALSHDTDPLRSRLLFAPDLPRGDDGTLFAEELYGRRFDGMRLVVLAACSTAGGRISRGEGALSLARPFLIGGVPDVIASLWDIEDRGGAELSTRLHRHLAAGATPDAALRAAQLELLGHADPLLRSTSTWAAFELIGGSRGGPTEER